jgi:hypothetical protein
VAGNDRQNVVLAVIDSGVAAKSQAGRGKVSGARFTGTGAGDQFGRHACQVIPATSAAPTTAAWRPTRASSP